MHSNLQWSHYTEYLNIFFVCAHIYAHVRVAMHAHCTCIPMHVEASVAPQEVSTLFGGTGSLSGNWGSTQILSLVSGELPRSTTSSFLVQELCVWNHPQFFTWVLGINSGSWTCKLWAISPVSTYAPLILIPFLVSSIWKEIFIAPIFSEDLFCGKG